MARYQQQQQSGKTLWFNTQMEGKILLSQEKERRDRMYDSNYDLNNPQTWLGARAETTNSDIENKKAWIDDMHLGGSRNKRDPKYSRPRQHLACQIDIATWHYDLFYRADWPTVSQDRIDLAMTDEFIEQFVSGSMAVQRTPVDSIGFMLGYTVLHEVRTVPTNSTS